MSAKTVKDFFNNLPGKTVEIGYGTPSFQIRGLKFVIDDVDFNQDEKKVAFIPRNQGPWVAQPYTEITLLTDNRIIVKGQSWVLRMEVQDAKNP